jgi:hypothetical protein
MIDVVGSPIPVNKVVNPSREEVEELHQRYVTAVQELYDTFKDKFHSHRTRELRFVK